MYAQLIAMTVVLCCFSVNLHEGQLLRANVPIQSSIRWLMYTCLYFFPIKSPFTHSLSQRKSVNCVYTMCTIHTNCVFELRSLLRLILHFPLGCFSMGWLVGWTKTCFIETKTFFFIMPHLRWYFGTRGVITVPTCELFSLQENYYKSANALNKTAWCNLSTEQYVILIQDKAQRFFHTMVVSPVHISVSHDTSCM